MTDCQRYQDDLKAYCDNELPALRRFAVRRHLSRCAACRKEMAQMEQIGNDLRASDTAVLDPALRTRILTNAAEVQPNIAATLHVKSRGQWTLGRAIAACAAVAVIATLVFPMFTQVRNKARPSAASSEFEVTGNSRFGPQADHILENRVNASDSAEPPSAVNNVPVNGIRNSFEAVPSLPVSSPGASVYRPAPQSYRVIMKGGKSYIVRSDAGMPHAAYDAGRPDIAPNDSLRRVHKEGSITVEVGNPEEKGNAVEQMVKSVGGFVASNNLTTGDDGLKHAEMTVKVPEPQFETVVAQIAKLGEVKAKNITGEDITEKISDSDRAENVLEDEVQKSETQLALKAKKSTWRDQETARDLRIQLSQEQARLQLLKKMATLANISVTLTEKPKAEPTPATGFVPDMKSTTGAAVGSLVSSAASLLSVVIWILAYAPIWVPVLLGGRYVYRQYQRKHAEQSA